MWDLINSSAVLKPRRITVQRSFAVINKHIAHVGVVLFKNIEGLLLPSDLVLKNISSSYISARVFGAGISLPVRLDLRNFCRSAE